MTAHLTNEEMERREGGFMHKEVQRWLREAHADLRAEREETATWIETCRLTDDENERLRGGRDHYKADRDRLLRVNDEQCSVLVPAARNAEAKASDEAAARMRAEARITEMEEERNNWKEGYLLKQKQLRAAVDSELVLLEKFEADRRLLERCRRQFGPDFGDYIQLVRDLDARLGKPRHEMDAPGHCGRCGTTLPEIPGDHQTIAAGDDGRRWDTSGPCPGDAYEDRGGGEP